MDKLKKRKIWIVWKGEKRNGRMAKIPYAANGEKTGTDEAHAYQWVTYEDARKAAQKENFDGVGFVIPNDMFFLDIDRHDNQHSLSDEQIHELMERFSSYSEKSVSGTGVHIYGKCDTSQLPTVDEGGKLSLSGEYYKKNPNIGLELYCGAFSSRFAVYTGDALNNVPLNDCTEAILETLAKEMKRKPKGGNDGQLQIMSIQPLPSKKKTERSIDVASIVNALRGQKNGEKFSRLYDGDSGDYASRSEADLALCALIAFRTGPNVDLIDSVFRTSKLYREKWERIEYRDKTIKMAIEKCHENFYGSDQRQHQEPQEEIVSAPYFIRLNIKTGEYYVDPPLLARYIRNNLIYIFVQSNANQGQMIYVYENGVYRLYNENMFLGKIKGVIAEFDEALIKMSTVREVYQQLITDLKFYSQTDLNANEFIINFQNGILQISETGFLLTPHMPRELTTIQIPCNWSNEPDPTPVFDNFIQTLADGDSGVIQLLLEFIGACLSNVKGWRMKKALFLVGEGDTGKSQLKSLVERLLGSGNFIGIDMNEIEARFGTGAIYGKRLAGSSDMSFMTVNELKTFKKLTGGDSLFAEFKGQQPFEFTYSGLLWFCMNRLPKFSGDDGRWVYERIMIVECPNVIPPEEQDKELLDKLYVEREGIISKALEAFQTVITNGYRFSEPEKVIEARKKYMEENNTVITFFTECMCPWPDGNRQPHCTVANIYKVYVAWCKDNNHGFAKTSHEFRTELRAYLGIRKPTKTEEDAGKKDELIHHVNGYEYFIHYGLTEEVKKQYANVYGYDDDFYHN